MMISFNATLNYFN